MCVYVYVYMYNSILESSVYVNLKSVCVCFAQRGLQLELYARSL